MRTNPLVRLLVVCLAALVVAPAALAGERMWIGFHDDPVLRYDGNRQTELDRTTQIGATMARTLVTWADVAPTKPRRAANPFDKAYKFDDLDEFIRNAQARGQEVLITIWGTPGWANGGKGPAFLPKRLRDFQLFTRALASRYSGRFAGYPYVGFYGIWNESNLGGFLQPQFDKKGRIVSPRLYAKLAAAGIKGVKAGNRKALVAIGETSSNGLDKKSKGTDKVRPGTFARLVAQANKKLKFDAWAHHPYPVPVNQRAKQKVLWPNVALTSLPQFEKSLDQWFRRKNIPVWITEYGHETKPGEPKGITEGQQALYMRQAIEIVRDDPRIPIFIWFIFRDSKGSLWQSGVYRGNGSKKRSYNVFRRESPTVDMRNASYTVKPGTKNPIVTGYVREFCANNGRGSAIGATYRVFEAGELVLVGQSAAPLGIDCTVPVRLQGLTVTKGQELSVSLELNTALGNAALRELTITTT